MPLVSIIIPTNRSDEVLAQCLRSIARQRFDAAQIQTVVVRNGSDTDPGPPPGDWPFTLTSAWIPEAGICAAKNRALDLARGEWIILLNDDTYVEPDFVRAHLEAHERLGAPAMVLGLARWRTYDDQTVFDRLVAEKPLVFFYDSMRPQSWYGFRHAWNLNLSLRRGYFDDVRFDERIAPVNFDDIEWAWRMQQRHALGVFYAPQALALHDHRYTLGSYLRREEHLGRMSVRLWQANPACYRAIYDSDLDGAYLEYCRQYVRREGRSIERTRLRERFTAVAARPWAAVPDAGDLRGDWLDALYDAHLPLKRLAFRRGVLRATHAGRSRPAAALAQEAGA